MHWKPWQWATYFTAPWLHYISRSRRQGGVDSFVRVQSALWRDNGLLLSVRHSNELVHHLGEKRGQVGRTKWGFGGGGGLRNAHPSGAVPAVWPELQPPQTSRPLHHCLCMYGLEKPSSHSVQYMQQEWTSSVAMGGFYSKILPVGYILYIFSDAQYVRKRNLCFSCRQEDTQQAVWHIKILQAVECTNHLTMCPIL